MVATTNSKRIAKNTLVLYVQMFISMLLGLYISRVVLNVLGVVDFGIYNVVGGVVAMFGVLNSAMSSSTSRFITYELGRNNGSQLKLVFSISLLIHLIIAVLVCLVAESVGVWFLKNRLQIPPLRMDAAIWVFHFSIVSAFIYIINVPYSAVIIAHEKMSVFAYFSLFDMVLKLVVVFLLQAVEFDRLKSYAMMLVIAQLVLQLVYWIYCYRKFEEVRGGLKWDKPLFKEMTAFAGWSMFGDAAFLLFTQGLNILLNVFFGATVNAARGIAVQVQGVISRFIVGFQTALNPQITKSYAANDLNYMHQLIYASSKYSFFLLLLASLPVFFETENMLVWWLRIVPEHTVNFVRIMLLISLIDTLANPLIFAAKATGKIKVYQSVLGSLLLLVVPAGYLALKSGLPPESVFIVHLVIVIIGQFVRVWLIRTMIELPLKEYVIKVIVKCCIVAVLAPVIPYVIYSLLNESFYRFALLVLVSSCSILTLAYLLGLDKNEKLVVVKSIAVLVNKYR
jgi:O-antigen/teichoic acid export membrane protein